MSFVKNVGRKRLGRLPIVTGSSNTNHDRKRPCQIESRASNAVEKVPRLASPEISNVDLSFSASFACDLESDLDLMSALDNMEKAFKTTDDQTKSSSGASLITTSNSSVQQGNKGHTRSVAPTSKDKDVAANKTPKQLVSAHKENKKVSGSVKSQRNRSVTRKHDPLQDDSFWSSPVNMSTPQNPLHTKSRRTSLNSSKSKRSGSRVPSQASKGSKVTGKGGQLRDAQILKTPMQEVQSARITRSSAKRSNQREARPKPVLAGLDGSHETPVRGYRCKETTAVELPSTNSAGKSNRGDFFKSLFMDNTSFDDISTLETESKKQAVAVRSKHNKNKEETTCSTRETNAKHLHGEVVETPENARGSKSEETSSDSNTNKYVKSVNVEHSEDRDKVETRKDKEEARGNKEEARRDTVGARSVEIDIQEVDRGSTEQVEVGRTTVSDTLVGPEVNSQGDIGSIKIQPGATSDQLALSSWGLPEPVLKQYHKRGITHMFQWQADCLLQGNVLGGGNLVYSAPTSAGKTMVAELLVLKRVLETRKKAIIILPFVSVTREKMFYLQELYQDAGIRVSGFMGSYSPAGGFRNVDVAVCTIEKGNGIINRCLEENRLDQLGILVVDELHLIGDPHRGYLLELLLTKIAYMVKKSQRTACQDVAPISIQVVGMSATLPNLNLLAGWLDADLYRTDYRPVPLTECVKIGTALYDTNMALIRDIDTTYEVKGDTDHVVPLCIETIRGGHSILIFCPTKNWCEKLSEMVAREFYNLLRNPAVAVASTTGFSKASDLLVLPLDQSALRDVVEQLKRTPVGVDQVLGRTVPFGVAYHHAGLTFDERDIVEGAFRQGMLKVLIATSTLSSGVNLPARRVLVRTPVFHGHLIDFLTYKQMIGRAGRKGVDTAGESILLCKPSERTKAAKLLGGELPPVQSTLIRDTGEELSSSMKRAILEVVVSGVAMAPGDVAAYASCTLLAASLPAESGQTDQLIGQCIKFLQENEFVTAQAVTDDKGAQTERFVPTQLGAAVLASSLSPDEGLLVFSELQRARQCFVLENELHIIYQVTPIYAQGIGDAIDWYQYFCIWESLNAGMKKVSELAGVKESFLARAVQGRVPTKTDAQRQLLRIHKRFYTALALHDLVQEVALSEVAKKYNCNKGQLQSLQQSAATFAGMVTVFCARLGWSNLELILSQFQNRLTFGVQRELCDLVRVSSLNGLRARVMFNGGYQTVAALASANPADIEALLKNSAPFQSKKRQDQETDWDMQARCKARCIFLTGRRGVTEYEAAQTIISEAKDIIQDELGGLGIQWGQAASGPPQLRTPVLTSPLARRGGRTKSVLGNRRSRSASKVGTTPDNAGSTRPSMPCVVSPPPADKHPAQSETSSAQNPEVQVDINNVSDKPAKVKNVTVENNRDMLHTNKEASVAVVTNIAKPSNSSNNSHSSVVNNSVEVAVIPVVQNWQQPVEPLSLISTDDVLSVKKTVKNNVSDEVCDNQHRSSSIAVVDTSRVKEKETSMIKYNHLKTDKPGSNSKQLNERRQPAVPEQSKKPAISIAVAQSRNKINNSRSSSANNISSASNIVINPGKTKTQQLALENTGIVQNSTATSSTSKENVDDGISFSDHMNDTFDIALRDSSVSSGNMKKENSDKCGRHIHEESDKSEDTKGNTETGKRNIRNSSQVTLITDYVQENPIHSSMEVDVGEKHSTMQNSLPMAEGSFIKSIAKTSLAPFTGSKSHIIEEDFADSFLIDTQVVSEMSNEQLIVSKDAQTICKIKDSEAANSNLLDIERSMHSPHKGSKLYAGNGDNLTGNEMVQRLSENKDDAVKESEDGKNLLVTSNEEQKPNESSDEILFSDESNTDLDNSCPRNTSAMVQKNEVSIDSDCNELDMNIGDRSDVDMFDRSEELVAASNYDHFGMTGESRTQVLADDSYQDLHIPYTSGQERCFEVADKEHPRVDHVRSVIGHNIGINSEGILGQFSSQRPKHVGDYSKLQEDLAVALEMGESFANTFSEATAGTDTVTAASDCDKPNTVCDDKEPDDNIGDSMTFSMMENALDEPNIGSTDIKNNKLILKQTVHNDKPDVRRDEYKSKQSCDMADLLSVNTLVNNDNELKVDQNLSKRKQQNDIPVSKHRSDTNVFHVDPISTSVLNCFNDDTFVTPTKAPNKRLRETPVARKQKIQKTEDIRDENADEMKLRSRKRTRSVEIHVDGVTEGRLDTSTGSDYVPPTPPGDDSMIGSTQEQHDTPKRTPFCSMKSSAAFSPRLKAAASARQCKQKLNEVDDNKHDANHMENGIRKLRSKDRRKKSNEEENRTTPDHSTGSKTTKKKPGQVVDSEEKLEFNDVETPKQDVVETLDDDVEEGEEKDKLSPSFIDPDESGLPLTQASFTIVDVCGDKRLFKTFILEWWTKTRYAVSLACEKKQQATTGGIGANFRKDYSPSKVAADVGGIPLVSEGHVIVGVAVSWDNRDAYYVSFTHDDPQGDPDDSLAPPSSDPDISITIRLKAVKSVLQQAAYKGDAVTMVMFDVKAHYRAMVEGCGFVPKGQFEDPRIACWMLDPGAKEKTLHRMVTNLLPTEVHMLHGIGGGIGLSSLGMSPANPGSGRYRATTEVVLVRHLGEYFRRCLEKEGLFSVFTDVEMPSALTLCRMELNGFGFSMEESESQKGIMIAKLSALEEQAYTLAAHPFSLSATEDVAQVLFVELLLPPSGDPSSGPVTRSLAPSTRGGARKGRQKTPYSTSKDILEKLKKLHPLPGVILEWRRITNALTKTVFPLQKEKVLCDRLSMYRIYSDCQLHTATGRISLSEPNLQNVPKDFEITMPDLIGESPPPNSTYANSRRSMGGSSKLRQMIGPRQVAMVTDDNNGNKFSVSMRHAFIPFSGGVLVAADYSQLELRMIAYLSDDQKLITVLNEEGDVFKLITAQWKNIMPHEVTPEQRAQAKQVCYGMIYGIGPKALGEQLEVEENDAAVFIETFKAKYPTMRSYLRKTVELCRVNGYVQTMLGRKRYLPQITGTNPHSRAQAERQAVNTTVQGSAADLVKMATNKIDQRLAERFPMTAFTHRQKLNSKVVSSLSRPPQGAFLVLQLHDELIYEVSAAQLMVVACIMKDVMETAVKLPVKMPVKLKAGPSWGTMQDMAL